MHAYISFFRKMYLSTVLMNILMDLADFVPVYVIMYVCLFLCTCAYIPKLLGDILILVILASSNWIANIEKIFLMFANYVITRYCIR